MRNAIAKRIRKGQKDDQTKREYRNFKEFYKSVPRNIKAQIVRAKKKAAIAGVNND